MKGEWAGGESQMAEIRKRGKVKGERWEKEEMLGWEVVRWEEVEGLESGS